MVDVVTLLIGLLLTAPGDAGDAAGLRATAPQYLNAGTAVLHLTAARAAGSVYGLDPDLLLSIAHHESRYTVARTPEAGGLTSCGVMTPQPLAKCDSTSVTGGYLEGAAHLRKWVDNTRDQRTALLGYGGGYRAIKACAAGPVTRVRAGRTVDLCSVVDIFLGRAYAIKRSRSRTRV